MSEGLVQGVDSEKQKSSRSREEAIPVMNCFVHKQEELASRVEQYTNTPNSDFGLPASSHHWLICQRSCGPQHFLVQAEHDEHDVSGLDKQSMIYIPPGTRTQWEFSPVEGSTHLLIPDRLLLQGSPDERTFAALQERGPLLGALMPKLSRFIHHRKRHLDSASSPSNLALSEFILKATEMLAEELSGGVIASQLGATASPALSPQALSILKDFMWDNIERNITLEELARLVHLSPFHFSRSFKKVTGVPPHQALLRMRVRKARVLLPQAKALTEIAYCCGFSDQAHFTRVFKAQTGFTPKQFRKATV